MPAACGIACEVCGFRSEEICGGGCVSGTDPKAPERVEKLRKVFDWSCPILECAIKNKVDYCLKCEKLPCDVHSQALFPYSEKFLEFCERAKQKK